jgi:DNA polymerase-3 subunit beta
MEIKVEKSDLLGLLAKTQNIVEKRNTMPILINVLLQAEDQKLKVFATDLEVSLTDEVSAEVVEAGKLAVDAKSFFGIVRELADDQISIVKKPNNWLEIKQNKSVFNIVGISPEEYPIFPSYNTDRFAQLPVNLLRDMIEKTIYSVSNDETRYHLNGVFFEQVDNDGSTNFRMVATDGHRLSMVDRNSAQTSALENLGGVIIPRKGLMEIRKLLDGSDVESVEMAIEGPQLIVRKAKTLLMIRLIEGKYPNYQQLIPQTLKNQVVIPKDTLISSLKRVSLLSNQKSKGITLSLAKDTLRISSNNPELGDASEEIDCKYSGAEIKIGFNAKYLLDVLNSFDDDQVDVELNDNLSPGLIRPLNDSDYTCIVMPMRI